MHSECCKFQGVPSVRRHVMLRLAKKKSEQIQHSGQDALLSGLS